MRYMHSCSATWNLQDSRESAYVALQYKPDGALLQPAVNQRNTTMARNFLHTAYDRMVTARERQVRRYVNGALLQLDDESLKILGRTREEINREGYQTYFF